MWFGQCFSFCNNASKNHRSEVSSEITTGNVRLFSYNSLRSATGDFHASNRLGRGGFGVVYGGVLRDGTRVAIKKLSAESKQGTKEFLTEIDLISNIKNHNLVQLVGCCIEGNNRILVYEFMENNSLASSLLGAKGKALDLDWPKRANICIGTASGVAYLHEEVDPRIVHRDIKASNVLLDENLTPKIGDFGLAKLFPDNVTHISTRVAGTIGYLAPEYASLGQLTKKADVYSFGVLVLEIVSGRSSSEAAFEDDYLGLVEWTWKMREEGRLLEIVDQEIGEYPRDEVTRFINVALFCVQASAHQRPGMGDVVKMLSQEVNLNENLLTAPQVSKPRSGFRDSTLQITSTKMANREGKRVNPHSTAYFEVYPPSWPNLVDPTSMQLSIPEKGKLIIPHSTVYFDVFSSWPNLVGPASMHVDPRDLGSGTTQARTGTAKLG